MNPEQSETVNREKPRKDNFEALQPTDDKQLCCGPGCACDGAPRSRKTRVMIMLAIVAAVVGAMFLKGILVV